MKRKRRMLAWILAVFLAAGMLQGAAVAGFAQDVVEDDGMDQDKGLSGSEEGIAIDDVLDEEGGEAAGASDMEEDAAIEGAAEEESGGAAAAASAIEDASADGAAIEGSPEENGAAIDEIPEEDGAAMDSAAAAAAAGDADAAIDEIPEEENDAEDSVYAITDLVTITFHANRAGENSGYMKYADDVFDEAGKIYEASFQVTKYDEIEIDDYVYAYPEAECLFAGWAREDGSIIKNGTFSPGRAMDIYATWNYDICTVSLDLCGGWFNVRILDDDEGIDGYIRDYNPKPVNYPKKTTIYGTEFSEPVKDGVHFKGWSLEENGPLIGSDGITLEGDCTLYAVWDEACIITLHANGGYFPDDDESKKMEITTSCLKGVKIGSEFGEYPEWLTPYRTFVGWSLTKGGEILKDRSYLVTTDTLTLYAVWEKEDINNTDIEISPKGYVYNGKAKEPSTVTVKYEDVKLKKAFYTVSYENNVNAGSGTAKVIVKGKSDFKGTKIVYFTIQKAEQAVTLTSNATNDKVAIGKTIKLTTGEAKGKLSYSASGDGKVEITDNGDKTATIKGVKAGKVTVTVKSAATSNYKEGSASIDLEVTKAEQKLTVSLSSSANEVGVGQTIKLTVKGAKGNVTYKTDSSPTTSTFPGRVSVSKSNSTTATIKGVRKGTAAFTVKAAATDDYYAAAMIVYVKVMATPSAPSVTVSNETNSILVTWNKVTYAAGYKIYLDDKLIKTVTGINNTSYKATSSEMKTVKKTLASGMSYKFTVSAVNSTVESAKSKEVSIVRLLPPADFEVTKKTSGVSIKWKGYSYADGYQIQYSTNKNYAGATTIKVTSKTVKSKSLASPNPSNKKRRYFRIRSYKGNSYSYWKEYKSSVQF